MTHCKKLIEYLEDQIENKGLLGLSGTNFKKHPVRRVLAAKQFEYRVYTAYPMGSKGKFASKALIAKDLLAMFNAYDNGECTPYIDETEETFMFNDSRKTIDEYLSNAG